MAIFNIEASGHIVEMMRTNDMHLDSNAKSGTGNSDTERSFSNILTDALGRVSDTQLNADRMFERMITHPDEVEPHDVTIAMAKAELSLNLTRAIVDRAVKAYTDITGMR